MAECCFHANPRTSRKKGLKVGARVSAAMFGLPCMLLAACQTPASHKDYAEFHAAQDPTSVAADIARDIGACWFKGGRGAFAGAEALRRGEPMRIGFLLGTRRYIMHAPWFHIGERLTVVWWRDEESLAVWRNDMRHRVAQQTGRARWYEYYKMEVAEVFHESGFERAHSMEDMISAIVGEHA